MTTVNNYQLYCITEATMVSSWGETSPTTCPHDTAHTIDLNSIAIIQRVSRTDIIALEPTDGWFQAIGFTMDIPAGTPGDITSLDKIWPGNLTLWTVTLFTDDINAGDLLSIIPAPDTVIGALIADVNISDTSMVVSSTVLDIVVRGLNITIYDGVNRNELGMVTVLDSLTNTVSFENPLTNDFFVGAVILFNVRVIKDYEFSTLSHKFKFGAKGFKGKDVPANTIIRFYYTNNDGAAKKLFINAEFYLQG